MGIIEIIKNAYKYAFNREDYRNIFVPFFLIGIAVAIITSYSIIMYSSDGYGVYYWINHIYNGNIPLDDVMLRMVDKTLSALFALALFIIFFACLILPGYSISVMKEGIDQSDIIPPFDFKNNIIDTVKVVIISIIYLLIPAIISLSISMFAGALFTGIGYTGIISVLIISLINLIIYIVFEILLFVGLMRFAEYGELREATRIPEVFNDLKDIGIIKLIITIIILGIITEIILGIGSLISFIPIIGGIVFGAIILPFALLAYWYALGSLYSDVT